MSLISEVRTILEAAKGQRLSTQEVEILLEAYEQLEALIKELNEANRFLRDAAELYRLKAAHFESQLQLSPDGHLRPATHGPSSTSPGTYKPSPDARRILAGLAEQDRIDFWSKEIPALSRGLGQSDIATAIDELLDHDVIEELSYTALEGTHYSCTVRGTEWIQTLLRHSR